MGKIGVAVCGNSGIDYLVHDKEIRKFRSLLNIGKEEYEDFVDISSDDFYSRLLKNPDMDISTAQTSTGKILEMYEEMKSAGYKELLVITISKQLSGTYQNAVLAARMIDIPVHVYDSLSLTYVEALMAMTAKKMADVNKPLDEILVALDKIRDNNHVYITVDTLKYLVKNGRLSGVAGALGSLLKLRPLLHLSKQGKVETLDKIRTTSKAREELKSRILTEVKGKNVIAFIVYTNNMGEMLDLKDELEAQGLKDVLLIPLTPVVGCHAGPGTMGVGYIEKV
ncbi:MAG: DegV family protein [Candidatus Izemoplasmatales bacterium]|jgi:DegV family protein with EDD domain|nr:DegV family protein [Candidatus Izemoplasmatales bacterium]